MLAILIYIAEVIRRTWRKILRAAVIITDSFREAQDIRRAMRRVYTEE